jgi:hypothetical protein
MLSLLELPPYRFPPSRYGVPISLQHVELFVGGHVRLIFHLLFPRHSREGLGGPAAIHRQIARAASLWIPAFAGTTGKVCEKADLFTRLHVRADNLSLSDYWRIAGRDVLLSQPAMLLSREFFPAWP